MAAAANKPQREEIFFPPNTPVTVALKFNTGRKFAGQGADRMMYTTPDERIFFVSLEVAAQIEASGVNVREPFTITQRWDGAKTSQRTWEVARIAAPDAARNAGEQKDGTFAVPKLPASTSAANGEPAGTVSPKPAGTAAHATNDAARDRTPRGRLEEALKAAVSAAYAAQQHATAIGFTAMPQFTGDDLARMANTIMIGSERAERSNAA